MTRVKSNRVSKVVVNEKEKFSSPQIPFCLPRVWEYRDWEVVGALTGKNNITSHGHFEIRYDFDNSEEFCNFEIFLLDGEKTAVEPHHQMTL